MFCLTRNWMFLWVRSRNIHTEITSWQNQEKWSTKCSGLTTVEGLWWGRVFVEEQSAFLMLSFLHGKYDKGH